MAMSEKLSSWKYSPWPEEWVVGATDGAPFVKDSVTPGGFALGTAQDTGIGGRYWWNKALGAWKESKGGFSRDVPEPTISPYDWKQLERELQATRNFPYSSHGQDFWNNGLGVLYGAHDGNVYPYSSEDGDDDIDEDSRLKSLVKSFAELYSEATKWSTESNSFVKYTNDKLDAEENWLTTGFRRSTTSAVSAGARITTQTTTTTTTTTAEMPFEEKMRHLAHNLHHFISEGSAAPSLATGSGTSVSTSKADSFLEFADSSPNDVQWGQYNYSRYPQQSHNATECSSVIITVSQWTYLYGIAILILIAILFNGLSFVVFRSKALRKHGYGVYLTVLSCVDSVAILSHVPRRWMSLLYSAFGLGHGETFYDTNEIACRSVTYICYVLRFTASWLVVAMASDRLTITLNAHKRTSLKKIPKVSDQLKVLGYIVFFSLALNCHVLFTWTLVENETSTQCSPVFHSEMLSQALTVGSVVGIVAMPLLLVGILTGVIMKNLDKWKKRARRLSANALCRLQAERRASVMVSVVTSAFCVLCTPYVTLWGVLLVQHFLHNASRCTYYDVTAVLDITEVVFMANYAVKFLLCLFAGRGIINQK